MPLGLRLWNLVWMLRAFRNRTGYIEAIHAFLRELLNAWNVTAPTKMAAALAYYAIFSIVPILYIAFIVAAIFFGERVLSEQLFELLSQNLGVELAQTIQQIITMALEIGADDRILVSIISLGAMTFAATGWFANLKFSLNTIWQIPPERQIGLKYTLKVHILALAMVLTISLVFILATLGHILWSSLISFIGYGLEGRMGNFLIFVGLTTLFFSLLYKILPDVEVVWSDVWIGAFISASLITLGRWVLGFYFAFTGISSAFDATGALALLLASVYYGAQIFLLGAVITRVYAYRYGSKSAFLVARQHPLKNGSSS
jgi:membrane protein